MCDYMQPTKDKITLSASDAMTTGKQPHTTRSDHTLQERMKDWDGKRYHSPEIDWGIPVGKEL